MVNCIKKRGLVFFLLIFLAFCTANVSAAFGTHINVSITERIYQETSFGENYTLVEWQKFCYSEGTINITNPNNETVYDISISFSNTDGLDGNFTWVSGTKFGNQTQGTLPGDIYIISIPELRQGNYSTFVYNISCMGVNPQLNIITNYLNTDHGFNPKVLSGFNWSINQTVRNDNLNGKNITNMNITMTAQNLTWNASVFPFALETLDADGDHTNVNDTGNFQWWWAPNGGELAPGENVSINFSMRAPYSVPFTATYMALKERIEFEVNYLLTNLTVYGINGSARVDFDFEKRITQPVDDIENHNVTWEITPTVATPVNITFDLNLVTLWVTEDQDPTNDTASTIWGRLEFNYTGSPIQQINLTTPWNGAGWNFNYTDGSNSSNPPPIVWMESHYLIANQQGQILNYTKSIAGNDIYMKYIYVIQGYWLEVAKNITNIGEDQYQIDIMVLNIGNGWTPNATYVTVFDYVPTEFAWYSMSHGGCPSTQCANQSVGSPGDKYEGTSFRWNIPYKAGMNSSLGPMNGPDATTWQNYSWNVSYIVNGTGPYRVTELYIVGLDPLKVDGAFTSPIITIISGIQTHTNEIIYISVILFLIIVNITNLVMTNRIHNKIQERLPPAPPPKQD